MEQPLSLRVRLAIYLSLLANLVIFFHKPLLSPDYIFPWDFRGVQLPMISYLADELAAGRFALWSPFTYCGYPIFANIEACFFHPFILAAAFLSAHLSPESLPKLIEWVVVLHIWIAGIAAFHLFRQFGAGRAAAWTGAVLFQTGGYFASRPEHIGSIMAVAWMPLCWLAVLKMREPAARARWTAILGFALGMAVLGGFPQPTLAVFVSTVVWACLLVAFRFSAFRSLWWVAGACILGIALSAVQFIPTTQLTENSVAKYRDEWLAAGGGLHWEALVSFVFPNRYHIFDMGRFKGPGDPTFLYLYCGVAGLLLAGWALVRVRTRYVALFGAIGFFGLFWMLGDKTPVWRAFYPLLPVKVRIGIHPEYVYCILILAIAGLAALGLQSIRMREALRWGVGLILAADLFLVGSGRPMNTASLKDEPGVTRDAFDGNRLLMSEVRKHSKLHFPPARIDTAGASMHWAINAPLTRIPTASGVSPLAPDRVIQLRLFLHDGFRWGWYYPVEKPESPVLDLMGVRYLIASGNSVDRLRALPKFRHVASLPGNELFENLEVMPRFFLVRDARVAASPEAARKMIEANQVDFRRTAITEEPIPLTAGEGPAGDVRPVRYAPSEIRLDVHSNGPSLLVMSETFYPGWKAWVDDAPVPIHRVNLAFRGIEVPGGGHTVRMEFRPAILPVSIGVSALAALALGLLAWAGSRARKPRMI